MISVDDRVGSIELIPILQSMAPILCSAKDAVIPRITSARMLCGDVCFDGLGQNKTVAVGIERKRLRDMINSIRSGRYSGHQLPEMLDFYDEYYLTIEGMHRSGPTGDIERFLIFNKDHKKWEEPSYYNDFGDRGDGSMYGKWFPLKINEQTFRYTELDHFICTIRRFTNVHVSLSNTDYDTASQIISLYTHYQTPPDKHHAHQAIHRPQSMVTIGKAGIVRKWAADLDGIGWERSGAVALKFRTGLEMANAGPEEWASIKPGFGKILSQRVYDQIRGIYKGKGEL